jgi:hypothetical protein
MHESKKRDAAADGTCCRALEVVAKLGWLSKTAWSVSKAVHAFSKPMLVVLADETPADIVQKLLLRYPIVAMQLEGSVIAPNPLPATVTELVLSADFCGSVADLPDTLRAFEATILSDADTAAMVSLLQRSPSGWHQAWLSACL